MIYFPHFSSIPTLNAVSQSAFLHYNSVNNYCTIQDIKMNLVNKKNVLLTYYTSVKSSLSHLFNLSLTSFYMWLTNLLIQLTLQNVAD